jgi:hypothetical protein
VAAPAFHLVRGEVTATEHLIEDNWRIVWQPLGELAPGAEREPKLRSEKFAFGDSVTAKVRVTPDRMDAVEATLGLSVVRDDGGSAEFSATVG